MSTLPPPSYSPPPDPPNPQGGGKAPLIVLGAIFGFVLLVGAAAGLVVWLSSEESPTEVVEAYLNAQDCEGATDFLTGQRLEEQQETNEDPPEEWEDDWCDWSVWTYDIDITDEAIDGDEATVEASLVEYYGGEQTDIPEERTWDSVFGLEKVDGEWLIAEHVWCSPEDAESYDECMADAEE